MSGSDNSTANLVRAHAQAGFSPSGIVAVSQPGADLEHHTWGEDGYDLDASFRVASLTKSFTALALLILRRAGDLSLDDRVTVHLPELRTTAPADWPELRIRHLLGMTSGLATDNPWGDRQESISRQQLTDWAAAGLRLIFPPGTSTEYSNLGYALLGEVISRVSGQDYREFVRRQLLNPLGLTGTRFSAAELPRTISSYHREPPLAGQPGGWTVQAPSGPGAFSAIGGLYSNARDLVRWANLFLLKEVPDGLGFTRADLLEAQESLGPVTAAMAEAPLNGPLAEGYGFGLVIENYVNHGKVVWHSGGYPGCTANMSWHVPSGTVVIASTNGTHSAATRLARQVHSALIVQSQAQEEPAEPWPETVAAVSALSELARNAGNQTADHIAGLFAENVELDFPVARRLEYLREASITLGRISAEADKPKFDRPSRANWKLTAEYGLLELDIELMPVAPFAVQTFSATIVRGASRIRLF